VVAIGCSNTNITLLRYKTHFQQKKLSALHTHETCSAHPSTVCHRDRQTDEFTILCGYAARARMRLPTAKFKQHTETSPQPDKIHKFIPKIRNRTITNTTKDNQSTRRTVNFCCISPLHKAGPETSIARVATITTHVYCGLPTATQQYF
jgi:hypothetical protein